MDKKNDFFLGAPLPLWGCVSIWLGNLVRLTPESAVPYAWAALFFSYGIWCCTIKVDIENSKSQYIEKDKQEATKDGSESTKI